MLLQYLLTSAQTGKNTGSNNATEGTQITQGKVATGAPEAFNNTLRDSIGNGIKVHNNHAYKSNYSSKLSPYSSLQIRFNSESASAVVLKPTSADVSHQHKLTSAASLGLDSLNTRIFATSESAVTDTATFNQQLSGKSLPEIRASLDMSKASELDGETILSKQLTGIPGGSDELSESEKLAGESGESSAIDGKTPGELDQQLPSDAVASGVTEASSDTSDAFKYDDSGQPLVTDTKSGNDDKKLTDAALEQKPLTDNPNQSKQTGDAANVAGLSEDSSQNASSGNASDPGQNSVNAEQAQNDSTRISESTIAGKVLEQQSNSSQSDPTIVAQVQSKAQNPNADKMQLDVTTANQPKGDANIQQIITPVDKSETLPKSDTKPVEPATIRVTDKLPDAVKKETDTKQMNSEKLSVKNADNMLMKSDITNLKDQDRVGRNTDVSQVQTKFVTSAQTSQNPGYNIGMNPTQVATPATQGSMFSVDGSANSNNTATSFLARDSALSVNLPRPQWNQRFAERISMLALKGASHARIRLDPPELGPMAVRIHTSGGETTIQFTVNNPIARELIDSGAQRLKDMLEEHGFSSVDVGVNEFSRDQQTGDSDSDLDESDIEFLSREEVDLESSKSPIASYQDSIGIIDIFA